MSKYWSDLARRLIPYTHGEQPQDKKYIKLNTNENPYPPSPRVIEAIKNFDGDLLKLYPDPAGNMLCNTIAQYYNLKKEQIFVGNGSDEVLAFTFMAFFDPGKPILFPDITYSFYPVYSSIFNIEYQSVELDSDFNIPIEEFNRENGGIIFPNPNAPTGKYLPLDAVIEILDNNPNQVVVIDEAYIDFGGESAANLIPNYPNLLVIQTLSKSRSLAGLRVGFAMGQEELIEGLNRIKNSINSYTLDQVAMIGAVEAFNDQQYFLKNVKRVIATRESVTVRLKELGFNVLDSKGNFLFISHSIIPASMFYSLLKERGILVRHFAKPRIDNFLRVSIGTDEEMNSFLKSLREIIGLT